MLISTWVRCMPIIITNICINNTATKIDVITRQRRIKYYDNNDDDDKKKSEGTQGIIYTFVSKSRFLGFIYICTASDTFNGN